MKILLFVLTLSFGSYSMAQSRKKAPTQIPPAVAVTQDTGYVYSGSNLHEAVVSMTDGSFASGGGNTSINLNGAYRYQALMGMQFGGRLNFVNVSTKGASGSYMGIWGTFTYNFDQSWNISNSIFAEVALGMVDTYFGIGGLAGPSEKKFSYELSGGKRIPLFDRFNYEPTAGIAKIGDGDMAVFVRFLNFSAFF